MGFRIMQLQYEPIGTTTNIEQGILLERPLQTLEIGFVKFISGYMPDEGDLKVTTIHEYSVQNICDGFKEIIIYPPIEEKVEKEEAILLIIPYAKVIKFSKGVKRIAGRYYTEGVFLLNPEDKITVMKGDITEEFIAIQIENKMYLVKIHND